MADDILDDILKGKMKQKGGAGRGAPEASTPSEDASSAGSGRTAKPGPKARSAQKQQRGPMDELFEELGISQNPAESQTSSGKSRPGGPVSDQSGGSEFSDVISDISWDIHSKSRKLSAPDELVIRKPQLYALGADEAKRYASAIEAITGTRPSQESFQIDALGHEPLISGLDDNYILVSPKQLEADILDGEYSFRRNVLRKLMDSAGTLIEQISFGEALYGRLKTSFSELSLRQLLLNLTETRSKIFNLEISLDTASNAIKTVKELQSAYAEVMKDPMLIVDKGYLEQLVEKARVPKSIHGPLDRIKVPDVFPVKTTEDFIKVSKDGQELYCFRDASTFLFIYFDRKNGSAKAVCERNCTVINGSNTEELIDTLFEMGLVSYSLTRGKEKLDGLKQKYSGLEESTKDVLSQVNGNRSIMPAEISDFYSILQNLKDTRDKRSYFQSLPLEVKLSLVVPLRSDRVLYEIIDRSTQTELMNFYTAGEPFIEKWKGSTDRQRQDMLAELMPQLRYEDQNSYIVNTWLAENAKEECSKQGISFRTEEAKL